MKSTKLQKIIEAYGDTELLKADGFDDCITGIDYNSYRLIYSVKKCIKKLQGQGMTLDEADEYFSFNVAGAHVGEKTPIWCIDDFQ